MMKVLVACKKGDAERFVKAGFSLVNGTGEPGDRDRRLVNCYNKQRIVHLMMEGETPVALLQRIAKQGTTFVAIIWPTDIDDVEWWVDPWIGIVGLKGRFLMAPVNHRHNPVVEVEEDGGIMEDDRQQASSFAFAWSQVERELV